MKSLKLRGAALCWGMGLASSGCGLIQNMQEMHDATEGLHQLTTYMYQDLRQGNSATIRRDQLRAMQAAPTQKGKIAAAAVYYSAFEFQLWKNYVVGESGLDSGEKLEALKVSALEEFLRVVDDSFAGNHSMSPVSSDSRRHDLFALAIALHLVNPNQEFDARERSFSEMSMLSLLKEGLTEIARLDRGEIRFSQLTRVGHAVGVYAQSVRELIQIRAQFLVAMSAARLGSLEEAGLFEKIGKLTGSWAPDRTRVSVVDLFESAHYLTEGMKLADWLAGVGVAVQWDEQIAGILSQMVLSRTANKCHREASEWCTAQTVVQDQVAALRLRLRAQERAKLGR